MFSSFLICYMSINEFSISACYRFTSIYVADSSALISLFLRGSGWKELSKHLTFVTTIDLSKKEIYKPFGEPQLPVGLERIKLTKF